MRFLHVPEEAIGNLWWLSPNPQVANFESGYRYIVGLLFLVAFPLNILIRTWTVAAAALLCQQGVHSGTSGVCARLRLHVAMYSHSRCHAPACCLCQCIVLARSEA